MRDNGERAGVHATIEREHGAEVRGEAVLRYSRHRVARDWFLKPRAYHVLTERALVSEERSHAWEREAQGTRELPTGGEVGSGRTNARLMVRLRTRWPHSMY